MKKSFPENLMNLFLRLVFFGYAAAFAAWWYVSPKGFPYEHPRFWANTIIPVIITLASLICWIGVFRSYHTLLSILMPSYPAATLAFIIAGMVLYRVSMRIVFLIPLLCWLAILIGLTVFIIKRHPVNKHLLTLTVFLTALSALMGAVLPWSQQSRQASTKPLNIEKTLTSDLYLNTTQSYFQLSGMVSVLPQKAEIIIDNLNTELYLWPLLTFYSRSPDRCWTLMAPRQERIRPKRLYQGMRRTENGLYLQYQDMGKNTLDIVSKDHDRIVELDAVCELPHPVYSHLNSFTRLTLKGKEKIFVSFSPCPDKRIEVTTFDYPFGRPARLAYLDASGMFRVVKAGNAEKGPFTTLAEGPLHEEQTLELTLYDGEAPVYRILFEDWARQSSTQLSPSAGWGLPQNAIEFSLDDEDPTLATFYITLASTSVGRGFDSVGHREGIYRNRMKIEVVDTSK
jgi:hypothetical protein